MYKFTTSSVMTSIVKKENMPTATIKRVTPLSPLDDSKRCGIPSSVARTDISAVAVADGSKGKWECVNIKLEYSNCGVTWIIARNSVESYSCWCF
jgi:hypothetical protein